MSSHYELSDGIANLLAGFEPHMDDPEGISIDQAGVITLVRSLHVMRKLAKIMEQEAAVHRLVEVSRDARITLEDFSTEALTHLVRDPEGKVIRGDFGKKPDFGRKS